MSRRQSQPATADSRHKLPHHAGRIIAHFGKQIIIEDEHSKQHRCSARRNLPPLVCGDYISWYYPDPKSCIIHELKTRNSLLARPDGRGKQKIIAANIDQILIVCSPLPELNEGLLDRYLVAATLTGIKPLIVLNKTDLLEQKQLANYQQRLAVYQQLDYQIIYTSAHEDLAFNQLSQCLHEKTSILVGQSGVGKSSLLNRLLPDVNARIGEVSSATGKGRHTTTTARLYHLPDSASLIDSPGIREFGLWNVSPEQLAQGFPEFIAREDQCRFRDCRHRNEPGCAILEALEKEEISHARHASYLRILASLEE
ncbi:Ribosome small subunit biogenesis RbfA-release protein RsgA [hydrothermal vent metagenome]|uniref:Ribosome small subunit biogenesis RbfA-release protein RsgA n=1 Tax=hydrothermal vent metagenome TaxID=652676 RepID=A0A3B1BPJ9_9ZZZZ